MRPKNLTITLIGLLLCVLPSRADEPEAKPRPRPLTTEQAVDAALEAFRAEDREALRRLTLMDKPDPWVVAEELCHRGEHSAAEALAGSGQTKAIEGLPGYLASRRGKATDGAARDTLGAMEAALRRGEWNEALERADTAHGPLDSVDRIRVVYLRGLVLRELDRKAESATELIRVGKAARKIGWLKGASGAYLWGGVSAHGVPDWRQESEAWTSRLTIERALGRSALIAQTLHNLGSAQRRLGNAQAALRCYTEALSLERELGDTTSMASTLTSLGTLLQALGNYDEALECHRESLELARAVGDDATIATTLNNLGIIQWRLGDFRAALLHLEEALVLERVSGSRARMADTLTNLGNVHAKLGEHDEARGYYGRTLEIQRELSDRAGSAGTLHNLGLVQQQLGKYESAARYYDEALKIHREFGDRAGTCETLVSMAALQERLGNYAESLRRHYDALDILAKLDDRPALAHALLNLGMLQLQLGNDEAALGRCEQSLDVLDAVGDRPLLAHALRSVGTVHQSLEDFEAALEYLEKAKGVFHAVGDRAGLADTIASIGLVLEKTGNPKAALSHYEDALEICRNLGDKGDAAAVLNSIGLAHAKTGDYSRALEAYERAGQLLEETPVRDAQARNLWGLAELHLLKNEPAQAVARARDGVDCVAALSQRLAEEEGASARDVFAGLFDVGYRAALRAGDADGLLWFLEQGRAGSLREALGSRGALEAAVVPEALREELGLARSRAMRALVSYQEARRIGKRKDLARVQRAWEEAQGEVARVCARIQREAKAAAEVALSAPAPLEEIQANLEPTDAMVLYGLTSAEAVALVVRTDRVRAVSLSDSAAIVAATAALLDGDERHVDPRAVAPLRGLLADALDLGKDVKNLLVSPTGRLGYVPFALLFPDATVTYVPSGTTYCLLLEGLEEPGEKILALGDPDYGTLARLPTALHRGAAIDGLVPLPATRKEVEVIGTTMLVGADASEAGLRRALEDQGRWRAVHFACHGLVDPDRPMLSSLALTADAEDDGFLTALEIFRMRIPADLVVLSACETGRGRIYLTEGIVGLTRAFMFAGAPRVMCSLWKVDDEATQSLMVKFYELWNPTVGEGLSAAAALREAQAFVRSHEKWQHPYYWAAWVVWGLPR